MTPIPYLLTLMSTLAVCFTISSATLWAFNGRTHKSESNFFSSLARLQSGIAPVPSVMLLGSSMTGRLPDRASGFAGVANLGCDGSSAIPALRAIANGDFPAPAAIVIEANTLDRGLTEGGEIEEAIRSGWFWAGVWVPQLGAAARPSAFVYSALFSRRHRFMAQSNTASRKRLVPTPAAWKDPVPLVPAAEKVASEIAAIVGEIRKRGALVLVVQFPCRREVTSESLGIAHELSRRTATGYLDLQGELVEPLIGFTDDVHLDTPSAILCLRYILESLDHY
jgi:hypothetical protein